MGRALRGGALAGGLPRRRRIVAMLLLPLALAACGGSSHPKKVPADAVALVGDQPITRAALESMLAAIRQSDRLKGQSFPAAGTADFRAARNTVLDGLVEESELEQQAKSQFGIVITDAQVERQLDALRARTAGGSDKAFRAALAQDGLTETQVRVRLRQQLLGQALRPKLSAKASSVSAAEIQRYYKSHLSGYQRPAKRQVRHILVRTRAQADALERTLANGGDFAALAKSHSIDQTTAAAGGALSVTQGQTLPAFDRVAFSLKTNAISPPVRTKSGWEIIQPTSGVTPRSTTPLSAVRSTIESALLATKTQSALPQWVQDTREAFADRVVYAPGFGPAT